MDVGHRRSYATDQAYQDYEDFVLRERSREPFDLLVVLRLLPNLTSTTLTYHRTCHLKQPQYSRLRKKIWLQPYVKDSVSPTVTWVLGAWNDFCRVMEIEINGNCNPYDIEGPVRADFIESLKITSMKCSSRLKLSLRCTILRPVRIFLWIKFFGRIWRDGGISQWPGLRKVNGDIYPTPCIYFYSARSRHCNDWRILGITLAWSLSKTQGRVNRPRVSHNCTSRFPDASFSQLERY